LLREGLIRTMADIYDLKDRRDALLQLERLGEKSVDNLLAAVEKSKSVPLARLIYGLGIRHVGEELAGVLAAHFPSIDYADPDSLANATEAKLMEVAAIGPKIAESVAAFFRQAEHQQLIMRLKQAGLRVTEQAAQPESLPLAGQEFVITGTLAAFSRTEAERRVKALGGSAGSSVTKKTTYLVVGQDPGSKLARAQELGTKQLTEQEFLDILNKAKTS